MKSIRKLLIKGKIITIMVLFAVTFASYADRDPIVTPLVDLFKTLEKVVGIRNTENPRCSADKVSGKNIVVYTGAKFSIEGKATNKVVRYKLYDKRDSQSRPVLLDTEASAPSKTFDQLTDILNPDVSIAEIEGKTVVVITFTEPIGTDEIRCRVGVVNNNNIIKWGDKIAVGDGQFSAVAINSQGNFAVVVQDSKKHGSTWADNSSALRLSCNFGKINVAKKSIDGFKSKSNAPDDHKILEYDITENYKNHRVVDMSMTSDGKVMIVTNRLTTSDRKDKHHKSHHYHEPAGDILFYLNDFTVLNAIKKKDNANFDQRAINDVTVITGSPNYSLDVINTPSATDPTKYRFSLSYKPQKDEHNLITGTTSFDSEKTKLDYDIPYPMNNYGEYKNIATCYLSSTLGLCFYQHDLKLTKDDANSLGTLLGEQLKKIEALNTKMAVYQADVNNKDTDTTLYKEKIKGKLQEKVNDQDDKTRGEKAALNLAIGAAIDALAKKIKPMLTEEYKYDKQEHAVSDLLPNIVDMLKDYNLIAKLVVPDSITFHVISWGLISNSSIPTDSSVEEPTEI